MADRYFVGDTDNDWNDAGNWSTTSGGAGGASVPTHSDNVFFDANSPDCIVDIAADAGSLNFMGYTGTITFNFEIEFRGNLTLSATMTFAGTARLHSGNAVQTITTNGKTIGVPFDMSGTSTKTLADNLTCSKLVTIGSSSTNITINGNKIFCQAGLTHNSTTGDILGTTEIVLSGTGTVTPSSSSGAIGVALTIDASGATVTIGAGAGETLYLEGMTLKYVAGTVNFATGNIVRVNTSCTFTDCSPITFLKLDIGTATLTTNSTINCVDFETVASTCTITGGKLIATDEIIIDTNITFANGFECANFKFGVTTTTITITLGNGTTSIVTTLFEIAVTQEGTCLFTSNHASIKANLQVRYAAIQRCVRLSLTRINAEGGQQIYAPFGTISDCLNCTTTLQSGKLPTHIYNPVSISGTVRDSDNQPVQGAIVVVLQKITESAVDYYYIAGKQITDVNGEYSQNVIDGSQAIAVCFFKDNGNLFTSISKPFLDA